MAAYVMVQHHTSISRACKVICLPKSMYYYTKIKDDNATILKLQELAEKHPTEGSILQPYPQGRLDMEL